MRTVGQTGNWEFDEDARRHMDGSVGVINGQMCAERERERERGGAEAECIRRNKFNRGGRK